eukprot:13184178-Alexandrium_andersonii.AAC.1
MLAGNVSKPVLSVRELCRNGSSVHFSDGECYVERNGVRNPILDTPRGYLLPAKLLDVTSFPPSEVE